MATARSLLTLDDSERQFVGNAGYEDDLARHYSWDKTVRNHARVSNGDLAVLRDGAFLLGVGWIDHVSTWQADRDRFRCPSCNRTGFKERTILTPRFKWPACGSAFDQPTVERLVSIDFYRADYARTWRPFDAPVPVRAFSGAYRTNAQQHAIREMDLTRIGSITDSTMPFGEPW